MLDRLSIKNSLLLLCHGHRSSLCISCCIILCCALACDKLFSLSLTADFLLAMLRQTVKREAQTAAELPVMLIISAIGARYVEVSHSIRLNVQGGAQAHFRPGSLSFYRGGLAAAVLCAIVAGDVTGEFMCQTKASIYRAQMAFLAQLQA